METISTPCNIHHDKIPRTPRRSAGCWHVPAKEEELPGSRRGGCPAKSLMGYRVPWGKWPQGALLGTSRGRVAEPEGFWDSIKLDNAIMRRSLSRPTGYHVKNRRAGCSIPWDRVRQKRVIRLVLRYWIGRRKRQHRKYISFGCFGILYTPIFHC